MNEKIKLPQLKCKRCGHTWYPKQPRKPRVCPKCTSPYWDKDYSRADLIKEKNKD